MIPCYLLTHYICKRASDFSQRTKSLADYNFVLHLKGTEKIVLSFRNVSWMVGWWLYSFSSNISILFSMEFFAILFDPLLSLTISFCLCYVKWLGFFFNISPKCDMNSIMNFCVDTGHIFWVLYCYDGCCWYFYFV